MAALQKGFEPVKLTVAEVKRRMDRGERFAFVDARSPEECTIDGRHAAWRHAHAGNRSR